MFTKPLFSSDAYLESGYFLISEKNGQLYKIHGYIRELLISKVIENGHKPLYMFKIKFTYQAARMAA